MQTWLMEGNKTMQVLWSLQMFTLTFGCDKYLPIMVLISFGLISFRYYTALERTLFFDHASDAHLRLWEINCEVHRQGLKLIKPGAKCSDIAKELNEIYKTNNLLQYRSFGYGHSFGTLCHYYGREAGECCPVNSLLEQIYKKILLFHSFLILKSSLVFRENKSLSMRIRLLRSS